MDCRSFRKHHLAYLDNTLPGDLLVSAECHVIECEACARHDTAVRRSLLLARNLAPIEPSPDFAARLEARLRAECGRPVQAPGAWPGREVDHAALLMRAFTSRTRVAAVAAGLLAATYAAGSSLDWGAEPAVVHRPAAVATVQAPAPDPVPELTSPDLVTPASTGVSVWPAALLADQVPVQLMSAQFQLTSYGR